MAVAAGSEDRRTKIIKQQKGITDKIDPKIKHGGKTEVSELLEKNHAHPNIRFTTWEDYAIMSMVERGLGIGVLPDMILKRIHGIEKSLNITHQYMRMICYLMASHIEKLCML